MANSRFSDRCNLRAFVLQTGLSGNLMILSVLYKGGLLTASQHMTVGELSSFLMYTFWVGISIAGNPLKSEIFKSIFCTLKCVFIFHSGLSSFYSELMKGFGAGSRLWELLERKPEFPLDGVFYADASLQNIPKIPCVLVKLKLVSLHPQKGVSFPQSSSKASWSSAMSPLLTRLVRRLISFTTSTSWFQPGPSWL